MRTTLLATLFLGIFAGLIQLYLDLQQEKQAVVSSSEQFVDSVSNSAATAVYNYYNEGAAQVAVGLFTQRAINRVVILANDSDVPMVDKSREVAATLPKLGVLTQADIVVLERTLLAPPELDAGNEAIGSIVVYVDKSIVPPAIVNRLFVYFFVACVKNFLLGLLLAFFVFSGLARYIIALADVVSTWRPGGGIIDAPHPPSLLHNTELGVLGGRISELSREAENTIYEISAARDQAFETSSVLANKSEQLEKIVNEQTSKLQQVNERLVDLAAKDSLTGLKNRGYFDSKAKRKIGKAIKEGQSLSLLMIDIDFFKGYNDFYGHGAGDDCIVEVGQCLEKQVSEVGGLLARYGGEEFVVLLSTGLEEAAQFGEKLVEAVRLLSIPHEKSNVATFVTVSVGVACQSSTELDDLESLYMAADEAMYAAKRGGRNRCVVSTNELKHALDAKKAQSDKLLAAIGSGDFEPFYQPQIDGANGQLIGVEALARWKREDGQIVSPADFIPLAEELNIVQKIDQIIFEKALKQLKKWENGGYEVPHLSVNVSSAQLFGGEFEHCAGAIGEFKNTKISFELLETTFLDAADETLLFQIDKLKELGIGIEVDDFGTGYTSIVGLMNIAPTRLKVARELVMPIVEKGPACDVVRSIIEIGNSLGIEVLCEGVETSRHAELLISIGCSFHQGFHYARPMSSRNFTKYMKELKRNAA